MEPEAHNSAVGMALETNNISICWASNFEANKNSFTSVDSYYKKYFQEDMSLVTSLSCLMTCRYILDSPAACLMLSCGLGEFQWLCRGFKQLLAAAWDSVVLLSVMNTLVNRVVPAYIMEPLTRMSSVVSTDCGITTVHLTD